MNKFYRKLKSYTKISLQALLFVLTAAALYFILPGEPKFKYEYQKGFPWRHENLVAPFDFAILKTNAELEEEKQQQIAQVSPYFSCDTTVMYQNIARLKNDIQQKADSLSAVQTRIFTTLKNQIEAIYSSGVLQSSVDSYPALNGKESIKKRTQNVVTTVKTDELFSEKTAYNQLHNTQKQLQLTISNGSWLKSLQMDKYIKSNLEYDEKTTQKEIDELSQTLSFTRGMVKIGQRVILEGEIVDNERFQVLESLKASYEKERGNEVNFFMVAVGKALLVVILLGLLLAFLLLYRRDVMEQLSKLTFLLLFITGMVFFSIFINSLPNSHIYLVPLAILPIVVRTFFDSRTAIFVLVISTLLIGFYAPNNYEYMLLQITTGIVAVFSLNKMHRRVHLVLASLWVFITSNLVFTILHLIHEGDFLSLNYNMAQWFAISSVLILLVYPLVYVFEKLFGFISDVTLIEISDSNQPLLRKLAEEAPGTFQHSMQIANLAEEVILKIGGNPFLVRAGALYHDIGKVARPNFFIENQAAGLNPHDRLNHLKSAEVIIDHVRNGVKMAQKHKLPEPIIEFISTHHGTTKAKYFYLKHQEENPNQEIDEQQFIYPGPRPESKEAAVVMLVDGIEAASRSMKEKTHENLKSLIDSMIDQKIADRQLDMCDLTFRDINTIKATLLQKLINIYHVRIEYPDQKNT